MASAFRDKNNAPAFRNRIHNQGSSSLSSAWKFILFLICWFVLNKVVKAVDAELTNEVNNYPNPLYQTNMFNTSVNFRQNVCRFSNEHDNGNHTLAKALKGFAIRAALGCPGIYCQTTEDGQSLDPNLPGLYVVLLDELARRSEFTWRDSFALMGRDTDEKGNKTFGDLLIWTTETYDISIDWWTKTTGRMRAGVDFPEGWYDGGIIMLQRKKEQETSSTFNPFTWVEPFSPWVWFMIVATIVSSGLVYWILEKIDDRSDRRKLDRDPVENIFLAGIAFTTHFEFHPKTKAAMLFTLSISFWALLTASAYTANLASFLVVKNTPGLQVTTLEDAVAYGYKICVWENAAIDKILTADFRTASLIRQPTEYDSLRGVANGDCDIAAVPAGTWKTRRRDEVIGECQLEWIGRKYKEIPAGFATRRDVGTKCTSLIADVIDIHIRDMIEEGFVDEAWENHLTSLFGPPSCPATKGDDENALDDVRLNMKNMGGIFILHFSIMGLVLLLTLYQRLSGRTKARNERLHQEERAAFINKMKEQHDMRKCLAVSKKIDVGVRHLQYNMSAAASDLGHNPLEDESSINIHSDCSSHNAESLDDYRDSAIIKATSQEHHAVQDSINELRNMQRVQSESILEIKDHLIQLINSQRGSSSIAKQEELGWKEVK